VAGLSIAQKRAELDQRIDGDLRLIPELEAPATVG
jgi:hypothetical protein